MRLPYFVSFILVLTLVWMQFYASVRETYNGVDEYKEALGHIKHEMRDQETAFEIEREQFIEFRQNVATLMPELLKEKGTGEEGYAYRNLASVVTRTESESVRKTIAKTVFEKGKEYFRRKEYAKANQAFRQIIEKFSFSVYVPESYFLMAEGQFKENEFEECTKTVQQMVEIFPQHELTGFALIRLGRIYEAQNRNEEAVDIYKTVIRSYPQRDVASQAKQSLRGLDL